MSTTATLPAGRELDALIDREVLKRIWDETRCRVCGWSLVPKGESGCWPDNCALRPRPEHMAADPSHWSTNMGCALVLLEHMTGLLKKDQTAESGWPVYRIELVYDVGMGCWSAKFAGLPVHGSSLPHAICLAALGIMPMLNRKAAGGGA